MMKKNRNKKNTMMNKLGTSIIPNGIKLMIFKMLKVDQNFPDCQIMNRQSILR